tara:strand:- start:324 stop:923 length:600 start_codon:yes stop_codon:yes gene_type:complete
MGLISNGTSIFDAGSMAAGIGSSMSFISKATASSSATIDFTSGIDSTYKEYFFIFKDIHPATDEAHFQFQADTGTNTNYNQTITSTSFVAYNNEGGTAQGVSYNANHDQAQTTNFQNLNANLGNGNDESLSGYLHLFSPSQTAHVKHFISLTTEYEFSNYAHQLHVQGYFNQTAALTRVRFKMSSGNIDAGTISLYGIA